MVLRREFDFYLDVLQAKLWLHVDGFGKWREAFQEMCPNNREKL